MLGTGTGVGKTHVACEIARAALKEFDSVIALKPVETGVLSGSAAADASALWAASGRSATPTPTPVYCFEPPISPHRAAREANASIETALIQDWVEKQERKLHSSPEGDRLTIVETAGGVFSPLGPRLTNLDLALALEPSHWLLVAPDALGVLHDVTAALIAMASVARRPDSVVLSAARALDASRGSNASELKRLGIAEPTAAFGREASPDLGPLWYSLRRSFPPGNH